MNNTMIAPRLKTQFFLISEFQGSSISIDFESRIVKIAWQGIVDEQTASHLLTLGADAIENETVDKILLDRQGLKEFTTEARIWIKHDLLKSRAKKLVSKVEKIATINPSQSKGSIFANFISAGIKMVFPNLKMEKFNSVDEALHWFIRI